MKFLVATCLLLVAAVSSGSPVPGDSIGGFTLRTRQDKPWRWTPGRTTVMSFCAYWCDTWKDQFPRVYEARQALAGLPVDFVSISVDGRWSEKPLGEGMTLLNDFGSVLSGSLHVDRVPYTLVVNPKGVITWAEFGTVRSRELVLSVRKSLGSSAEPEEKPVYLTFDDFPAPRLNFELIDTLRSLGVPATLFCICSHLQEKPDLVQDLLRQGIHPQVHAWEHNRNDLQLERCRHLIVQLGFPAPVLYRSPGSETVQSLRGVRLSLPVVDPYDYLRPSVAEISRRVLLVVRPGSVIQLHAGVSETLEALPGIVENLEKRGFVFRLLGE